ncbi:alpha/beta fold hydrolase [Sphaerisporangium fuscum]|uniref:alpha/beta fold hydrolase n=1 Tax=Sphaerisporangium fuscum TaxID=2835868 RepID=UPI001BDD7488|nr:alpha/beta hydrolase [Sphaerisporangium fuscum]
MSLGIVPPVRLGESALADGRKLGWAEWGPEDGVPVLLCPGAATSRWLGFGGDVVDELGVRLVSADRPGLGASDPLPSRTLEDWPRDVEQLTKLRGLEGLAVVGFSAGAPFALACAAAGIVTAASIVSGGDELAHPEFAGDLPHEVRFLVDGVAADRESAEASMRSFADPEVMTATVKAISSRADRQIYADPEFAPAFRRALEEGFSQGHEGYARDTAIALSRWPFDPAHISVPVDLWYGMLDSSPVHSPDLGDFLSRRIPTATRHVVPDTGGALLWTHAADILRALLGHTAA